MTSLLAYQSGSFAPYEFELHVHWVKTSETEKIKIVFSMEFILLFLNLQVETLLKIRNEIINGRKRVISSVQGWKSSKLQCSHLCVRNSFTLNPISTGLFYLVVALGGFHLHP